jgi:hypothetical protein
MKAIETLNNDAFNMFQRGSWKKASRTWSEVLKNIAPEVRDLKFESDEDESAHLDLLVPLTLDVSQVDERIFPLFAQGLRFIRQSATPYTTHEYQRLAAVTCYNIGLCHHIQGLVEPQSLRKAIRAYRHARDILDTCTLFVQASVEDQVVALAITNNVGHILEQTYETDQALRQLHLLEAVLTTTMVCPQVLDFHLTCALFSRTECSLRLHAPAA